MNEIKDIIQKVYLSNGFNKKGFSIKIVETFFISIKQCDYIVFLVEKSSLRGEKTCFKYVLYSLRTDAIIDIDSEMYESIVGNFPSITELSYAGAKIDFERKMELMNQLEDLILLYVKHGELDDEIKEKYINLLNEMRKIKAPSFQNIYDYFLMH